MSFEVANRKTGHGCVSFNCQKRIRVRVFERAPYDPSQLPRTVSSANQFRQALRLIAAVPFPQKIRGIFTCFFSGRRRNSVWSAATKDARIPLCRFSAKTTHTLPVCSRLFVIRSCLHVADGYHNLNYVRRVTR